MAVQKHVRMSDPDQNGEKLVLESGRNGAKRPTILEEQRHMTNHVESACGICGNRLGNRTLTVREMMHGTGEPFEYVECGACGHLQIAEIPENLGRYYANGYYSYRPHGERGWRKWLKIARTKALLGGGNTLDRILAAVRPPHYGIWLRQTGLKQGHRLLDVGCGAGNFIRLLQECGLDCTGIDPFLAIDEDTSEGVKLRKRTIEAENGRYHAILFSHSLEHVSNPRRDLQRARELLLPEGVVVIRIPLADSLAFFKYGPLWFQLDAPRHLNLFTKKSLALLADTCGFEIQSLVYDSNKDQFWVSEEYGLGIGLHDPRSFAHDEHQTHFSKKDIRRWARWALWCNEMGVGDQAVFLLRGKNLPPPLKTSKPPQY